jgi:hypothetical protein
MGTESHGEREGGVTLVSQIREKGWWSDMAKRIGVVLIVAVAMITFCYTAQAQTGERKWKKTVTLPNGEVILDISGEWDVVGESYGQWSMYGTYQDVFKITQEGTSFEAIRMKGTAHMPAGSPGTRGKLNKNGFEKVWIITPIGPMEAKAEISEDGDKIVIDDHWVVRQTFTRK